MSPRFLRPWPPAAAALRAPPHGRCRDEGRRSSQSYEYMSKCSDVKCRARSSAAQAALTPFSRTRYYPNSARNWPTIYTLRVNAALDRLRERARSPPAWPRQASERIKAPLERPVIEVQHITKRYGGVTA